MALSFRSSLVLAIATAAAACAAPSDQDATETASDEIRALKPGELLGELRYGESSGPISYTEDPTYRAFRFEGADNDEVDIWVRSSNGNARAWLLRSSYSTVVANDDASSDVRDSHIVAKLASSGTYYIAFREKDLEDATFTVSLARKNVVGPGNGKILDGANRSFPGGTNQNNLELISLGQSWEGYISFDAAVVGEPTLDKFWPRDRTGTDYPTAGSGKRYERLPVPIKLFATTDSSVTSTFNMTNVKYEITSLKSISPTSGKFVDTTTGTLTTFGEDLRGLKGDFDVTAKFFSNFNNGNACGYASINGADSNSASFDPSIGNRRVSLAFPITVVARATCISPRTASPENADADVRVTFGPLSVGN